MTYPLSLAVSRMVSCMVSVTSMVSAVRSQGWERQAPPLSRLSALFSSSPQEHQFIITV